MMIFYISNLNEENSMKYELFDVYPAYILTDIKMIIHSRNYPQLNQDVVDQFLPEFTRSLPSLFDYLLLKLGSYSLELIEYLAIFLGIGMRILSNS